MSYREIARAILMLLLEVLNEPAHDQDHDGVLPKQKRYRRKEAPARRYAYVRHASEEEHRTEEEYQWRAARRLSSLTAFLAATAVVVGGWTLWETRRQANDSHKTLLLSQAAFVYTKGPSFADVPNSSPPQMQASIMVGNSGGTQTTDLVLYVSTTSAYNYSEVKFIKSLLIEKTPAHFLLGPKEESNRLSFTSTYDNLFIAKQKGLSQFVYGFAYYRDIVNPTFRHITEFCTQVQEEGVTRENLVYLTTMCPEHNCADAECVDYRKILHQLSSRK